MAALTRATARDAVKTRMGLSTGMADGLLTDTVINLQLQFAINDIAGEYDWPWLQTTATVSFSAGTAATPTRMKKMVDIDLAGKRINRLTLTEVLRQSTPYPGWYQEGATLKTYPAGQTVANCTAHYVQLETDLTSDGLSPLLPEEHHQTWVLRTAWRCAAIRRDQQMKLELGSEYGDDIARMRDDVSRYAGSRQVRNLRGRWS